MKRVLIAVLFVVALSSFSFAQENVQGDSASKNQTKPQSASQKETAPSKESGTPSAPASVKLTTPTLNMDVLLDLYNKDIDFTIDYSGQALKKNAQNANIYFFPSCPIVILICILFFTDYITERTCEFIKSESQNL